MYVLYEFAKSAIGVQRSARSMDSMLPKTTRHYLEFKKKKMFPVQQ